MLYKSIETLPLWNWQKIHETNDLSYLGKSRNIIDVWLKISDEFVDEFGISDAYRAILELQKDIAILNIDMILDDDPSLQTFIDIKEHELRELLHAPTRQGSSPLTYLSKWMGGGVINPHLITVKEFYSHLREMEKDIKNNGRK